MITNKYKFLEKGEIFFLLDSGEHDGERILVFGIESGLDDLVKYKDCGVCNGAFQRSPDMYCQLHNVICIDKKQQHLSSVRFTSREI